MMSMVVCKTMIYIWKKVASPDNNFVDDATLSNIKTDDNYSAMAKAAANQNVIEKTNWGNE